MGAKKDNKGKRPLLRPMICICNDHNAHSLAKLRPLARQLRFSRPADLMIVRRLREVCEIEGLKADSRALSTLVGVAQGDLRGCLNALQVCRSVRIILCILQILCSIVHQSQKWRGHRTHYSRSYCRHEGSRIIKPHCSQ